jgi:hypothetical protein
MQTQETRDQNWITKLKKYIYFYHSFAWLRK